MYTHTYVYLYSINRSKNAQKGYMGFCLKAILFVQYIYVLTTKYTVFREIVYLVNKPLYKFTECVNKVCKSPKKITTLRLNRRKF